MSPVRSLFARVSARLLFLLTALSTSTLSADEFDALRERIRAGLNEHQTPSLAVAVAREGEILWEEGFGWADRERRIPSGPHTMYSLASISKPITATGLMLLVERGQIDLDKPMNDYLGDAKLVARVGDAAAATVRRVANHTAGLPLHYQFFYVDEPYRRPSMDETIRRYGNILSPPGERFVYSNLGYGLLDYAIARASGRSYADFLRTEVFLPLGMTRASVDLPAALKEFEAVRYAPDGQPIPFYDFDHPGGSAVYCSAHDLVRFGMFHAGDRQGDQREILSADALKRMQTPTTDAFDGDGYGVGWRSERTKDGHRVVSHSGGMGGVSTILKLVPDQRVVVVALANSRSPLPATISDAILDTVLKPRDAEGTPPPAESSTAKGGATAADRSDDNQRRDSLQSLAGRWKGHVHTYQGDLLLELKVQPDGDVHVELANQLPTLLTGARYREGWLQGRFAGHLGTDDVERTKNHLVFELKLRGDHLQGGLTAMTVPANRAGNALTHWVDLKKAD